MRVRAAHKLTAFIKQNRTARQPLEAWHTVVEKAAWHSLAELTAVHPDIDKIGNGVVFRAGGGKYRIACTVSYATKKHEGGLWIRSILKAAAYQQAIKTAETVTKAWP